MKKERIVLYAVFGASFLCVAMIITVFIQSHELDRKKAELKSASEQIERLQINYKAAQESIKRANDVVSKFLQTSKEAVENNVKTLSEIENEASACDWLNAPLPDVVRFNFCTSGSRDDKTAKSAHGAL